MGSISCSAATARADRVGHLADIHLAGLPGDLTRDHQSLLIAVGHGEHASESSSGSGRRP
jgi:hypothetical protein